MDALWVGPFCFKLFWKDAENVLTVGESTDPTFQNHLGMTCIRIFWKNYKMVASLKSTNLKRFPKNWVFYSHSAPYISKPCGRLSSIYIDKTYIPDHYNIDLICYGYDTKPYPMVRFQPGSFGDGNSHLRSNYFQVHLSDCICSDIKLICLR